MQFHESSSPDYMLCFVENNPFCLIVQLSEEFERNFQVT